VSELDDPYAMYLVVRKDRALGFGRGMVLAGAATVGCLERYGASVEWVERPRKVALRADADAFARVRDECPAECVDDVVVAVAPLRKSERPPVLVDLRPFTDARQPSEPPAPPEGPAVVYVIRPGVVKTLGKAMAQAGHAAQLVAESMGSDLAVAWREAGRPGEVRAAGDEAWGPLKACRGAVAVADAGLTQVAPGTETVLALPPGAGGDLVDALERIS
jgi:peptidyl-tRNA hydrolase